MIEYGFGRKSTYALEAAYAYKVRLLRVSDLRLRAWPSDLVDDLVFSETSSGFVTRAICDNASDLIFSELLAGDRLSDLEQSDWFARLLSPYGTIWLACTAFESVWNDLIGLYGFWVRMERSDWLVRLVVRMEQSGWLVRLVVRMERSNWLVRLVVRMERSDRLVRLRSLYGTIWLACTEISPYGSIWLAVLEICLRAPSMDFLSYKVQTVVSRTTRKRYAKCVLFCDEIAVHPAVACNTNKWPSLFIYYLLYPVE